jgi:hypothetical protein
MTFPYFESGKLFAAPLQLLAFTAIIKARIFAATHKDRAK